MLIQGSKIKLIKPMGAFKNIGEICEVTDVAEGGVISFRFGGYHLGCMSYDEFLKYFEQVDMIVEYAQIVYKTLLELKKEEQNLVDTKLIERIETNHIRTNLRYDGITIHIRSLKEYIDEDFKLYAIQTKKYLKICKHCGKAFIAKNPKTEYDTFSCKNQANVYKSRARMSKEK